MQHFQSLPSDSDTTLYSRSIRTKRTIRPLRMSQLATSRSRRSTLSHADEENAGLLVRCVPHMWRDFCSAPPRCQAMRCDVKWASASTGIFVVGFLPEGRALVGVLLDIHCARNLWRTMHEIVIAREAVSSTRGCVHTLPRFQYFDLFGLSFSHLVS